jgi:hypothetical protein
MTIRSIPKPSITRVTVGALDADFAALRAGTDDCYTEVVSPAAEDSKTTPVEKLRNKLSSAINSYRQRTGDKSAFSIREIEGGLDGMQAVGVWKEAKDFTPRQKKVAVEAAVEA